MFKKLSFLLVVFFAIAKIQAQDYFISFAGSGETTTVETVVVENLMQETTLTLNGTDVLHLVATVGTDDLHRSGELSILVYPNPAAGNAKIEFELPAADDVQIDLYDLSGRLVFSTQSKLAAGTHYFNLNGLASGIYTLNVKSANFTGTAKVVSLENSNRAIEISPAAGSPNTVKKAAAKNEKETIQMLYTIGDRLLFKGISGNYTTISTLVATEHTTVTFNFVAATDIDGNHYATVTISNQVWMAENLRVITYPNGIPIPHITDNTAWGNLADDNTSDAYSFFDNDNSTDFGALYTYAAAIGDNWVNDNTDGQGVCLDGWHLPAYTDWTELADYLGDIDVAGGKLKVTGTTHWNSPNAGATNESGFSALPGGYRARNDSGFGGDNSFGFWWSAAEYSDTDAWCRYLDYMHPDMYRVENSKSYGFSIRCVRD